MNWTLSFPRLQIESRGEPEYTRSLIKTKNRNYSQRMEPEPSWHWHSPALPKSYLSDRSSPQYVASSFSAPPRGKYRPKGHNTSRVFSCSSILLERSRGMD